MTRIRTCLILEQAARVGRQTPHLSPTLNQRPHPSDGYKISITSPSLHLPRTDGVGFVVDRRIRTTIIKSGTCLPEMLHGFHKRFFNFNESIYFTFGERFTFTRTLHFLGPLLLLSVLISRATFHFPFSSMGRA